MLPFNREQYVFIMGLLECDNVSTANLRLAAQTAYDDTELTTDEIISKYRSLCPGGYDTLLGFVAKFHPEFYDTSYNVVDDLRTVEDHLHACFKQDCVTVYMPVCLQTANKRTVKAYRLEDLNAIVPPHFIW